MKIAFRQMCVTICGRFDPNEGGVVGYVDRHKADRKSHGIGLANIKSTAEKYQGIMDFRVKDRVFILSVMMKNERREEDGFRSDR
ncbi:MAG: ATP-binding protein [Lachnospiraceae bacterium]|nr:ATP-binding protein [Lachnospiraceae bacterium]